MIHTLIQYHLITSFIIGYILDLLFGDPRWLYHFVQFEGSLIHFLDPHLNRYPGKKRYAHVAGFILWLISVTVTFSLILGLIYGGYYLNPLLGFCFEVFFVYQSLATHSLKKESMQVYDALENHDLPLARTKLSRIVGRDTEQLSEEAVIRADVETVAENTSDGVICPLFYLALFGVAGGVFCKLVNTLDSMVGYKNETYQYFGTVSAKIDDVIQYFPARLTASLMIIASFLLHYDTKNALKIWKRDRYNHESINSAQSEATMAGMLDVQLGGDTSYGGVMKKKKFIGDPLKKIEKDDILKAHNVLYFTSFLAYILISTLLYVVR